MLYIPEDLEQVIFSHETFDFLRTLWTKYNLDNNEQATLGSEVGLYLSGVTKEKDFAPRLMYALNRDRNTADSIKGDVDGNIVSKVKKSFEAVQNGTTSVENNILKNNSRPEKGLPNDPNSSNREDILRDIENPIEEPRKISDPDGEAIDSELDKILKISKDKITETNNGDNTDIMRSGSPLRTTGGGITPTNKTVNRPVPQSYDKDPYRENI